MARLLCFPLFLLALAAGPAAQLDLPRKPPAPQSSEPPKELPARQSGDLAGRPQKEELDLPAAAPAPAPVAGPETQPPATLAAAALPSATEQAAALLAELELVRTLDEPRFRSAQERWLRLGPEALVAARSGIESEALGVLVTSARELLIHGTPEDRQRVAQRLRRPVPALAAGVLLEDLAVRDPVVASPAFLCELLDHPTAAMRQAAQRELHARADPSYLPFLAARLGSARSDTRSRALEIVARMEGDEALRLVASCLGDPVPRVAAEALRFCALEEGQAASELLHERAFADGVAERGAAHALLALVEREERTGRVELTLDEAPVLLAALRAGEPIVSGAAAAALAGIGFRNPASPATAWLDLEVPHALVRLGSGAEFHRDFSTLQPIALQRLALISGESFGSEGLAWRRWWTESARGFRARRAVLAVEPGDEEELCVELWRDQTSVRLAGPRSARAEERGTLLVSAARSKELLELLRAEGVLGLERLPHGRGHAAERGGGLALCVQVGEQEKRFEFSALEVPAWAERLAASLDALASENAWQRFRDRARFATQHTFVGVEGPWWQEPHTAPERARRLADLVLASLATAPAPERRVGLEELERLFAEPGVAAGPDIATLTALLAGEEQYGERVEQLVDLILRAARERGDAHLDTEESGALAELCGRHGEPALGALGRVLRASGPEAVRAASRDPRPLVRRAAARAVAGVPSEEATELLQTLLDDPDVGVALSAIEGLGENATPEVRELLAARASDAPLALRPAYLRAVGRAGGEGARDVLVLALAEEDPRIQLAAVEGLAELADPGTASVLVSVLTRGRGPEWSEHARRGLARIGAPAWPQLLRVASSTKSRGQREAALLLSQQGVADAAPILMTLLTLDPEDTLVAEELAVLSCVDYRSTNDPQHAWWEWWDLVVHDDALAWFRAGLEREGLRAPEPAELALARSREAALFLVEVIGGRHPWSLAERARRELEHVLGLLEPLPLEPAERAELAVRLRPLVQARFETGAGAGADAGR